MRARLRCLTAMLLLLAAAPAGAVVPSTMGYQGLLTDGGGNPLPSGPHALAFSIYDVASGGTALWTESHASVPVTNGGFSVMLGSVNSLVSVPFDKPYWLGIRVDGGSELAPRIPLASSPSAFALRLPMSATQSDPATLLSLKNLAGYPASVVRIDPNLEMRGTALNQGGFIDFFGPDDKKTIEIWSGDGTWGGGQAGVYVAGPAVSGPGIILPGFFGQATGGDSRTGQLWVRGSGSNIFSVNGVNGNPTLALWGGASQVTLNTGLIGDTSVQLPPDAVGPGEILAEPGISQGMVGSSAIPIFPASIGSVVSTTITIPMSGYVTVDGSAQSMLFGTTAVNGIQFQISQSASGPFELNYMRTVGWESFSTTGAQYPAMVTTRTYFLAAGTHTFHFIAQKTGPSGSAFMVLPTIRATFVPTSYGTVTAAVSPGDDLVDLRDLELRATRARVEAERTERELAEARMEAEIAAVEKRVSSAGPKKPVSEVAK